MASAQDYIFNWLIGYSMLLGPIAAIMIADYFVLRGRHLDVEDLYRTTGRYAGTNKVAVGALILGILPNVPGFLKSAGLTHGAPDFFDAIYPYTWFTGFALAFGLYLAGMKLFPNSQGQAP
jgi:NCS1 family nucleobase:cation symporter-1